MRRYPEDDEDELRKAQVAGVPPVQFNVRSQGELQIKSGYLGIAMTYIDQREVMGFINSFDGFEYRLASMIYKMVQEDKKTVAFLTGHGQAGPSGGYQTMAGLLANSYRVREIDASEEPNIDLGGVDALIIGGPSRPIPEETTNAVRQYIADGGKAMILIDSFLVDESQLVAGPNRNSFRQLPEEFGVIVEDDMVFDLQSNETLSFSSGMGNVFLPYPFWVRVPVVDRKVGGNVESVILPWASSIGITESERGRDRGHPDTGDQRVRGDRLQLWRPAAQRADIPAGGAGEPGAEPDGGGDSGEGGRRVGLQAGGVRRFGVDIGCDIRAGGAVGGQHSAGAETWLTGWRRRINSRRFDPKWCRRGTCCSRRRRMRTRRGG